MIYNKLVRDKIPEIIKQDGKNCIFKYLSNEDYLKKIDEELKEYHEEKNIEELADPIEAIYATAVARGYSVEELRKLVNLRLRNMGHLIVKYY